MRRTLAAIVATLVATAGLTLTSAPASAAQAPTSAPRWLVDLNQCSSKGADKKMKTRVTRRSNVGPRVKATVQVKQAADNLYCLRVRTANPRKLRGWQYKSQSEALTADHKARWAMTDASYRGSWIPIRTDKAIVVTGSITLVKKSANGRSITARYASNHRTVID